MAARAGGDDMKVTNFTRADIEVLQRRFLGLLPQTPGFISDRDPLAALTTGKIDRSRFRDLLADVFGVDDSLLMDRVFRTFDTDADNYISWDEFHRGMSTFLKGRPDERTKFCFRVYDLNGDRYISKEEMFQMLRNCLVRGQEEDEDGVKDLVDLVLKKLDEDRDGRVSESDWALAIGKEGLLMEAFGQCLPRRKIIERYLDPYAEVEPISSTSKLLRNASSHHQHRNASPHRKAHYHGGSAGAALGSNSRTASLASELATEAAEAMQPPKYHPQRVSRHVHPKAPNSRRIVVAPAAGMTVVATKDTAGKGVPRLPAAPVAAGGRAR